MAPGRPLEGVLLIDKPAGMSSHEVVAAVRRSLAGVRTGHAGTLDPFATGLLLVLVGRATKLQRALMELPKRYETVARLGAVSSTGDTEGQITHTGRLPADPPQLPTGQVRQRPPIHSAVKLSGERAYRRARRGERFELPERVVTVYRFEQVWRQQSAPARGHPSRHGPSSKSARGGSPSPGDGVAGEDAPAGWAGYEIECGSGTYVRSLIADLGDAYCVELRRTAIGPFDVRDAVAPPPGPQWRDPPLIGLERALALIGQEGAPGGD
jgi:tRNA pseudouridine55 synthase